MNHPLRAEGGTYAMGCEYKIYGSVTLRRSPEVDVLLEALRERLDDGAVEVEALDDHTIDLTLNFDDSTTVHTPSVMDELFKQMEPFVIGAGSFDIETSGANWTEYLGKHEEVTKLRSASALRLMEEHIDLLTAVDRAKLGAAGEVLALRNALGALMGNIPPPQPAELEKAGLGSLAYNWRRAKILLEEVPVPELATNEFIVLHKLQVVLQEELDALRIWRTDPAYERRRTARDQHQYLEDQERTRSVALMLISARNAYVHPARV